MLIDLALFLKCGLVEGVQLRVVDFFLLLLKDRLKQAFRFSIFLFMCLTIRSESLLIFFAFGFNPFRLKYLWEIWSGSSPYLISSWIFYFVRTIYWRCLRLFLGSLEPTMIHFHSCFGGFENFQNFDFLQLSDLISLHSWLLYQSL